MVNSTNPCPRDHEDEVFYDVWQGMSGYCDCIDIWGYESEPFSMGLACTTGNNSQIDDGCRNRNGMPPRVMADLGNFKVCGKRGGDSFLNANRPIGQNEDELICDIGTPCDPNADIETALCYVDHADCPITEIQLSLGSQSPLEYSDSLLIP